MPVSTGTTRAESVPNPAERRKHPRLRPGRIVYLTFLDTSVQSNATLIDVSESGIGLLADQPLQPGTVFHLEVEGHLLVATVAYCQPAMEKHCRMGLTIVSHVSHVGGGDWNTFLDKWRVSPSVSVPAPKPY